MLGREVDEHGTVTVVGCRISCHVQTACSEGSLTGGSTFSRNASRIKSGDRPPEQVSGDRRVQLKFRA
jgi:hypothetical protein